MSAGSPSNRGPETRVSGPRRFRQTPRSVYWRDRIAKGVISLSGVCTIFAVFLVGFFLLWIAIPLFRTSTVATPRTLQPGGEMPLLFGMDEYQTLGWLLYADGSVQLRRMDTGEEFRRLQILPGQTITGASLSPTPPQVALGFADGTVRLGTLSFGSRYLDEHEIPKALERPSESDLLLWNNALVQKTPEGQFRLQDFHLTFQEPIVMAAAEPIVALSHLAGTQDSLVLAALTPKRLMLATIETQKNLFTGETTLSESVRPIPFEVEANALPAKIHLTGLGHHLLLFWPAGQVIRFNLQNPDHPFLAETFYLERTGEGEWTDFHYLNGHNTFLATHSEGSVHALFGIKPEHAEETTGSKDEMRLVSPFHLSTEHSPIRAIASSVRSRIFAVGHESGNIEIYHGTSLKRLAKFSTQNAQIEMLLLAPKDDALWALTHEGLWQFRFQITHPEISFTTLFLPVWYEGYEKPSLVWQSSSGSDDFQEKFSLIPLIFGTLKATFYSLVFGVPIALLAAIYTSEFLHPRWRGKVKQTLELMATLPSVVLGFLAASIFSPFLENVLPAVMTAVILIPIFFFAGAYLWQFLPGAVRIRLRKWRLVFTLCALVLCLTTSGAFGSMTESLLFGGDIKLWLDFQIGGPFGGWFYLLFPFSAVGAYWVVTSGMSGLVRKGQHPLQIFLRKHQPVFDLLRFFLTLATALGLSALLALTLGWLGFDTRGSFFGTYVQRNSLVVGFIMGFAIIPIIFTLAEDALSMVPDHLRTASLGAGATPWQTAYFVVIPAAMSGIFSAIMIGLGRAVGETMIVLMAAGNTPILDMNIFNGFRTLSANLAVELPEAVKNSSHYRTLFLSGLILFAITAVLNTLSEVIRLKFRKKIVHL